jgi:hypothetical protein
MTVQQPASVSQEREARGKARNQMSASIRLRTKTKAKSNRKLRANFSPEQQKLDLGYRIGPAQSLLAQSATHTAVGSLSRVCPITLALE